MSVSLAGGGASDPHNGAVDSLTLCERRVSCDGQHDGRVSVAIASETVSTRVSRQQLNCILFSANYLYLSS